MYLLVPDYIYCLKSTFDSVHLISDTFRLSLKCYSYRWLALSPKNILTQYLYFSKYDFCVLFTAGTRLPCEEGLEAEERGGHSAAGSHQRTAGQKNSWKDEERRKSWNWQYVHKHQQIVFTPHSEYGSLFTSSLHPIAATCLGSSEATEHYRPARWGWRGARADHWTWFRREQGRCFTHTFDARRTRIIRFRWIWGERLCLLCNM